MAGNTILELRDSLGKRLGKHPGASCIATGVAPIEGTHLPATRAHSPHSSAHEAQMALRTRCLRLWLAD